MSESVLKQFQNAVTRNGIAHLYFYAQELTDIIHPFSFDGYELLSGGFAGFLEKHKTVLPEKAPIVIEIIGREWTGQEKELIDNTLWTHFCLNMDIAGKEVKRCIWKSARYLIYTLLSVAFIFAVSGNDNELVTNLAYVPFWFFGYRLLTYLILDLVPACKSAGWYERLASAKLIFSREKCENSSTLDYEKVRTEVRAYRQEAGRELRHNKLFEEYLIDDGIVSLGCKVRSVGEFILAPNLKGREFLSDEMAAYLERADDVVPPGSEVELTVDGAAFSGEEQTSVRKAIRNYYSWVIADEEKKRRENDHLIAVFLGAMAVTSLLLLKLGRSADAAGHEFILILFWFFADYLLEFVLISRHDINKKRKSAEACARMKVNFIGKQQNKALDP